MKTAHGRIFHNVKENRHLNIHTSRQYFSCSFFLRKKKKKENLPHQGETREGPRGARAPGRSGPFIWSHGKDQALTDSDTCCWEICSPSVSRGLFLDGSTGRPLFPFAPTAKVFWDSWHSGGNNVLFMISLKSGRLPGGYLIELPPGLATPVLTCSSTFCCATFSLC